MKKRGGRLASPSTYQKNMKAGPPKLTMRFGRGWMGTVGSFLSPEW
jgi:hypothetical protein